MERSKRKKTLLILTIISTAVSGWNLIENGHPRPGWAMIGAAFFGGMIFAWRQLRKPLGTIKE